MRIYLNQPDHWATGYYRSVLPHRHCSPILQEEGVYLELSDGLDVLQDCDTYIFHRLVAPQFIPHLLKLKKQGKRIIWSTDDLLTEVPPGNPARNQVLPNLEAFHLVLNLADDIIVSTEELAHRLPHKDKTIVLPNLVDLQDWDHPRKRPDDVFRIMWAGSDTHAKDLELIVPVVREMVERHSDVEFVFFGMTPTDLVDSPQVVSLPLGPLSQYPRICSLIAPHVALAPLQDNPFNRSKSPIKWMEGALSGAMVVASPLDPYTSVIDDGLNGYLANTTKDWVEILEIIHEDRRRARPSAVRGYMDVQEYHSWQNNAGPWMDFFRGLSS